MSSGGGKAGWQSDSPECELTEGTVTPSQTSAAHLLGARRPESLRKVLLGKCCAGPISAKATMAKILKIFLRASESELTSRKNPFPDVRKMSLSCPPALKANAKKKSYL